MSLRIDHLRDLPALARRDALLHAAEALAADGLVVFPTETAYVLGASAAVRPTREPAAALETLKRLARAHGPAPSPVWLAPTVDGPGGVEREVREDDGGEAGVGPFTAVRHRRVLRRLAPGPAIFLAETGEPAGLTRVLDQLGMLHGAADDGGRIAFRVSGQPSAAALAAHVETPLVCVEVPGRGGRGVAQTAEEATAFLASEGIEPACVLEEGPVRMRAGATVLLLRAAGGFEVVREGAYEARFIGKQLERTVLFVCTGNTCRSPMAEAIAAGLMAASGTTGVRVESAGAAAGSGMPMTPEAAAAVRELGFVPRAHVSRPLTRKLIAEADVVLAMTRSHAAAVVELDPGAAEKVVTLDPTGRDVPDPIGMGPEVYSDTARRLLELISGRLKELQS